MALAIKDSDLRAFSVFFYRHEKCVYDFPIRYLNSVAGTEETIPEVLLKIWNNKKEPSTKKSLKSYLFPLARKSILVSERNFTPGTPEANEEKYIPTATTMADMFIQFIYNEKAREFLSEGISWEDQHNAGILYDRIVYFNQMASDKSGLWPAADNGSSVIPGQDGKGKGQMKKAYTFRFWPKEYLDLLTDQDGRPLDEAQKQAYQNPGY